MVFLLLVVSRISLFITSFIAHIFVPYLGFFPYKELLVEYKLPTWVSSLASFDGIHYLLIAKQGYSQWEQAFFPLYPLLIRLFSLLISNYLVAALLISNISFGIGLFFFQKLLKEQKIKSAWPLFFLLSFPTAFFFGVVYTEGLFFMLLILSLYFLHTKSYRLAGFFAALASATRLVGIFLVIPFFLHFLTGKEGVVKDVKSNLLKFRFIYLTPLIGLFIYMTYLWISTGDPLFFFNSQPLFGANRSTHLILLPQVYFRYLRILFTANHDFQWYLSLFEVSAFTFVFVILLLDLTKIIQQILKPLTHLRGVQAQNIVWNYNKLGLSLFSLINLILPTLTGTFSSIPRYALFSVSAFLYLAQIESKSIRIGIIILFATFQILLLSLFVQGYFIG